MSKYLFLASHVDDADTSCGGTIVKLISEGHFVHVISFTEEYDGVNLYPEFNQAMLTLGVETYQSYIYKTRHLYERRQEIADLIRYWSDGVDYVFTHSKDCIHPDHRVIGEESLRVVKGNLITYEQPWNMNEDPNYFVELSQEQLDRKIAALTCYKSQAHRPYMDPDFIRSWARYTGIKAGCQYAEGFKILRLKV